MKIKRIKTRETVIKKKTQMRNKTRGIILKNFDYSRCPHQGIVDNNGYVIKLKSNIKAGEISNKPDRKKQDGNN